VAVIFFILALVLQLGVELLGSVKTVKNNNRKVIMRTNKRTQNADNSKVVKLVAMKVSAGIATSICGRCLLP
jgi:hypothetical protein